MHSMPALLDATTLTAFLRSTLGSACTLADYRVVQRRDDYAVVIADLLQPVRRVVVKLAGPGAPIACPFETTAAIVQLVRRQTTVPTFEVLAVDTSYRQWPWRYLVTTHVPGSTWAEVRPQPESGWDDLYAQLGEAVAQLHTIHFSAYGEIAGQSALQSGGSFVAALAARAARRIAEPRYVELFTSLLGANVALFDEVRQPMLCHEDLNPHNILLHNEDGAWHLAAILDFDSAWAGSPESDYARLELWRGMSNAAFRRAYMAVRPLESGYPARRPLLQLLWCLEYASPSPEHFADTAQICGELDISPIAFPS